MTAPGSAAASVGLPVRPFLYTLDQIAMLLVVTQDALERSYLHFDGRHPGARPIDKMLCRNIAPVTEPPDWRVAERELIRWMRRAGFRVYERGYARA